MVKEILTTVSGKKQVDQLAIIHALNDEIKLKIFFNGGNRLPKLTRKQYYGRLHVLIQAGLVKRVGAKRYVHTSVGHVVLHLLDMVDRTIKNIPVLEAYDNIKNKTSGDLVARLIQDKDTDIIMVLDKKRVEAGAAKNG